MNEKTIVKESDNYSNDLLKEAFSFLTLNCSFVSNLGLFHGKMGCVLFFASYARYTRNKLYEDFAYELLDELYEDITNDLPIGLENGLCGIGWGVEYLVQNSFMEGDTDEILEDIDKRIMEYDVHRMSDLSFRQGLAGIVFYVIARFSALRDSERIPFDSDYLSALGKALLRAKFSEVDECPPLLIETYFNVINGVKLRSLRLPEMLGSPISEFDQDLSLLPIGLENGIAGTLLYYIKERKVLFDEMTLLPSPGKDNLIIFDEVCRGANYGIGTYLHLLLKALKNSKWHITVVHLKLNKGKAISMEKHDNATHLFIANIKNGADSFVYQKQSLRYYRNVLMMLNPYLAESKNTLFHLNYMRMIDLANVLKGSFPHAKMIVTVHYTEWSFNLLGDKAKLQEILLKPEKKENQQICKCVDYEKQLLNVCDQVIAIARHSYDDLVNIYGIPSDKITIIPHGIEDVYQKLTDESVLLLKQKYGYEGHEKILVFAGRLDMVKGEEILVNAFIELVKIYPELRLIIAGDGDFKNILSKMSDNYSKLTLTGFVDKKTLYELFSMADIGVLPSLHEEFGYVALEMMMMGLPLVVGGSGGLSELVENGKSGITIPLSSKTSDKNVLLLVDAIRYLLDNPQLLTLYGNYGREIFSEKYTFDKFKTAYEYVMQ